MFKCHVIIFLFLIMSLKESYADFWCKDSALWDLLGCLHLKNCKTSTNDVQFYIIFACAREAGDCIPTIGQRGNVEVSLARDFYKCMKNCLDSPSKSKCWKSCDKFSENPCS